MKWLIAHDNGIRGHYGCSDGYESEEEATAVAQKLEAAGAVVYQISSYDTNAKGK